MCHPAHPREAETEISGVPGKPGLHSAPEASLGYRRPGLRNSHLENNKCSFLESSTQPHRQSSESRPEGQACSLAETNQDAVPCITSSRSTVIGCESLRLESLQRLRRLPGPLQAATGVRGNCDLPPLPPRSARRSACGRWEILEPCSLLCRPKLWLETPSKLRHTAPRFGECAWGWAPGQGTQLCKGLGLELSCAKAEAKAGPGHEEQGGGLCG